MYTYYTHSTNMQASWSNGQNSKPYCLQKNMYRSITAVEPLIKERDNLSVMDALQIMFPIGLMHLEPLRRGPSKDNMAGPKLSFNQRLSVEECTRFSYFLCSFVFTRSLLIFITRCAPFQGSLLFSPCTALDAGEKVDDS